MSGRTVHVEVHVQVHLHGGSEHTLAPIGATGITANSIRFPYVDLDLDVDLGVDVSVLDTPQRGARLPEMAAAGGKKQTVAW